MDTEQQTRPMRDQARTLASDGDRSRGRRPSVPPRESRAGCVSLTLGVLLVLVGIPMLVCPGPGLATVTAGVGMIAVGLGHRRSGGDT